MFLYEIGLHFVGWHLNVPLEAGFDNLQGGRKSGVLELRTRRNSNCASSLILQLLGARRMSAGYCTSVPRDTSARKYEGASSSRGASQALVSHLSKYRTSGRSGKMKRIN